MPKLFLIPNVISNEAVNPIPAIAHVRTFFVEEPKSARRLLKALDQDFSLQECRFLNLNEHTTAAQVQEYAGCLNAADSGIIAESGCPCVADPGANLVLLAHQQGIDVVPLVGPSSILLALMASGLNGQNFAFSGYLPIDAKERAAKIKHLEQRAHKEGQTQIFMETPYRNQVLFNDLLKNLNQRTWLSVACDIMGSDHWIRTKTIGEWQKQKTALPKKPALFIIGK